MIPIVYSSPSFTMGDVLFNQRGCIAKSGIKSGCGEVSNIQSITWLCYKAGTLFTSKLTEKYSWYLYKNKETIKTINLRPHIEQNNQKNGTARNTKKELFKLH